MSNHFITYNFNGHSVPLIFFEIGFAHTMNCWEKWDALVCRGLDKEAISVDVNHDVIFSRRPGQETNISGAAKLEVKFNHHVLVFRLLDKDASIRLFKFRAHQFTVFDGLVFLKKPTITDESL